MVMPSCLSAACSASSDSILFSFLMFSRMLLNCSFDIVKPSSLPRCTISSSSTASTMTWGVTSRSAFCKASSLSGRRFGFFCRSAAICRCSRSVLVTISPFTLTSTCSRMVPWADELTVANDARTIPRTTATAAVFFIGLNIDSIAFGLGLGAWGLGLGPRTQDPGPKT